MKYSIIEIITIFLTFDKYTSNDNVNGINKVFSNIITIAFTVPNTTVFFEDNNTSINHITITREINVRRREHFRRGKRRDLRGRNQDASPGEPRCAERK